MEEVDIEHIIMEAAERLKTVKLENKFQKQCQKTQYADLQNEMNQERGHRNLKLFTTYSKDWAKREEMAKDKLSNSIKKQSKKQEF